MSYGIDIDLDVEQSARQVYDQLVNAPEIGLEARGMLPSDGVPDEPIYRLINPKVLAHVQTRSWNGPGREPRWSDEVEGIDVPRRVEISFVARYADANETDRTAYRTLSWLIRNVPGNYFLVQDSGEARFYHVDGQTWAFDRPGAWNDERGWPEDWGVSVPYRFRKADRSVPDPLPPMRNVGKATPTT